MCVCVCVCVCVRVCVYVVDEVLPINFMLKPMVPIPCRNRETETLHKQVEQLKLTIAKEEEKANDLEIRSK